MHFGGGHSMHLPVHDVNADKFKAFHLFASFVISWFLQPLICLNVTRYDIQIETRYRNDKCEIATIFSAMYNMH